MAIDRAELAPSLMIFVTSADNLVTGQTTAELAEDQETEVATKTETTADADIPAAETGALSTVEDLHTEEETAAIAVIAMMDPNVQRSCVKVSASIAENADT